MTFHWCLNCQSPFALGLLVLLKSLSLCSEKCSEVSILFLFELCSFLNWNIEAIFSNADRLILSEGHFGLPHFCFRSVQTNIPCFTSDAKQFLNLMHIPTDIQFPRTLPLCGICIPVVGELSQGVTTQTVWLQITINSELSLPRPWQFLLPKSLLSLKQKKIINCPWGASLQELTLHLKNNRSKASHPLFTTLLPTAIQKPIENLSMSVSSTTSSHCLIGLVM